MNKEELLKSVRKYVKKYSSIDDIHGFGHVKRVFKTCNRIGNELDANMLVLKISALLHDIGRKYEGNNQNSENHATISVIMAQKYFNSLDHELIELDLKNIYHSIEAHSFSNNILPKTLEAKILSDSDKLDALGAIGLYRTIGFTIKNRGNLRSVLEHLENKILKLKDRLYLNISRKIAEKKEKIVLNFYNEIKKYQ
jgi:uncharacterized protein